MNEQRTTEARLSSSQQTLNGLWEEHLRQEFTTQDTGATLETMVPDAYVNHVPVLTGGVGHEQLREFYSRHFIPRMPPDTDIVPVSRACSGHTGIPAGLCSAMRTRLFTSCGTRSGCISVYAGCTARYVSHREKVL